ncbi:hypothetical protein BU25DRAFT_495864 [Macroventuria anomochaeta]|uniref:Uncharacterized protein n=1 Tax=Macroventuria anomochaeta TaxID=301207 RepID=A0ACB6RIS2_9PLEO|nr:uncharacterized protein BU25DRAFT_495864 [Macroventuria anomochaeta]KAF2621310.1 hypothetical protein BU25DRAFT_495864 [Macroventuria anomochaeta]
MTLPLTDSEDGHVAIHLPHTAALGFCSDVPDAIDDSKNSFPLKLTIALQPKTLPVRDEIAVDFCKQVRKHGNMSSPTTKQSTSVLETNSSLHTSTPPLDLEETTSSQSTKSKPISTVVVTTYKPSSTASITAHTAFSLPDSLATHPSETVDPGHTSKQHPWMEAVNSALSTAAPVMRSSVEHVPTAVATSVASRLHSSFLLRRLTPHHWSHAKRHQAPPGNATTNSSEEPPGSLSFCGAKLPASSASSHVGSDEAVESEQSRQWCVGQKYDPRIRRVMIAGWVMGGLMVLQAARDFARNTRGV